MSERERSVPEAALAFLERSGALRDFLSRVEAAVGGRCGVDLEIRADVAEVRRASDALARLLLEAPHECQALFRRVLFAVSKGDGAEVFLSSAKGPDTRPLEAPGEHRLAPGDQCLLPAEWPPPPSAGEADSFYPEEDAQRTTFWRADAQLARLGGAGVVPPPANLSSESQIHTRLRIGGVPFLPPFRVEGARDLCEVRHPKTAIVAGLVVGFSLPAPYTIWSRVLCRSGCRESAAEMRLSTWSIVQREDGICKHCCSPLIEDPSTRKEGEQTKLLLLPSTKDPNSYFCERSLILVAKDCDKKATALGNKIEATVFVVPSKLNQIPILHISSIYPPISARTTSHIPKFFKQLLLDRCSSPWSLVLTLAYMFCSNITPPGTFIKLKMALLLSLASCSSDESVLAILAVGKSELVHKRLLRNASQIAPSFVMHSSLNELEGKASKGGEGTTWVEAGSLLRAKGGVCVVDDLANIKKETKSAISRVLENEEIRIEIPTEVKSSFQVTTYPLRTCIWSSYNPCVRKKAAIEEDILFLHVPVGDLSKSISDVFGLVVFSDFSSLEQDEETEKYICADTLFKRLDESDNLSSLLPMKDLIEYLEVARSIKVSFTKEAENLLRGYYVTIRRLRGTTMPVTAIDTLTKVAKCHARLALRKTVDVGDAAAAILLFEEALAARTGLSTLGVQSNPHLSRKHDLNYLLGRKNDDKMRKFLEQITHFISEPTCDFGPNFPQ